MVTMYGSVKFKFVCESIANDTLVVTFKNDGYYYKMVGRFLNEGVDINRVWINHENGKNGEKIITFSGHPNDISSVYETLWAIVYASHEAIDVIFDTIADAIRLKALNSTDERSTDG